MPISAASKTVRFFVGLAIIVALLVVSSNQLAGRSVTELAGANVICTIASDHGGGDAHDTDCGFAGRGHSGCLTHAGCSGFTLPSVEPLTPSPISPRWLQPQIRGRHGRIIPLETPPPIAEA